MTKAVTALIEPFLCLLYPPRCSVCGRFMPEAAALCSACVDSIDPVPEPICELCGQSLSGRTCSHCRNRKPAFDRARSLGCYEGVLRAAIHRCKFRDRPQLATPLGHALADFAQTEKEHLNGLQFDAVIPVPMYPARRRRRGYNQAERLAAVVAEDLVLPLAASLVGRTRPSRAQVGLSAEQRQRNLTKVFAVPKPDLVRDGSFLLIDDVTTTGSTLHECARALKEAGAKSVYCLTLAAG